MSVIDIERLLNPVSSDRPCGPNMEYDPPFLALQELARGKPEQVIGDKVRPAQEPAWPSVRSAAADLFASTKDLRVAGVLYLALIKSEGIAGLDAGLSLIRTMLERYWDALHPLLDAEDGNDPTFRINALISGLVSDEALFALRAVPLVESRQFGKHSLRSYRIATGTLKAVDTSGELNPQQELARIEAAFSDVPLETISTTATMIAAAAEHLNAIQHILLDKADGIPDDLKPLSADVKEIKNLLDAQMAKRGVGPEQTDPELTTTTEGSGEEPVQALTGSIRNRTDVLTTIDKICDYYARNEPSSPVPMLLQRAKRLVNKDFMEIIRDLTPGGVNEAELIGGLEKGER